MEGYSRRGFIKGVIGAGVTLAASSNSELSAASLFKPHYDSKGLPTVKLGSTGVEIPRIIMGLGSRFCHMEKAEDAYALLNYALDNGLYYWETANIYDNSIAPPPGKKVGGERVYSEVRVGEILKTRRKEVFLSTKLNARDPYEAQKQLEISLKRLNTDKVEVLNIHDVQTMEDVEKMSKKGQLIDVMQQYKEQGVTRFIGFTGHTNADALKELTRRGNFDTMLVAMNHWRPSPEGMRQEIAVPAGKEKKMGVLLMKVIRPKETIAGMDGSELVSYALSLEGPDALVIGMDSIKVLDANLQILRNFKKLSPERMKELAVQLTPFYQHENLPWMKHYYKDGFWNC